MLTYIIADIKPHWIEITAAMAAVLSAFYSMRSNIIAKKALTIAKKEFENKQSNFDLYYIDGYRQRPKGQQDKKILLFNLTINNKSELKNTFKASLEIEFIRQDDSVARTIIDHDPNLEKILPQNDLTVFPKDLQIEGNGMSTNWLLFEQPTDTFEEYRIEKYTIKVNDIHQNEQTAATSLLKDIEK